MRTFYSMSGIVLLIVVLANCSPKSTKSVSSGNSTSTSSSSTTTTSSSGEVYKPSRSSSLTPDEMAAMKTEYGDLSSEQLAKGRTIYESSCKKCHKLHAPASRNAEQWMTIMRKMGPKAKLDQDHYKFVSAYLVASAAK